MNTSHYQLHTTLTHHKDLIAHLQFSPDGRYLASGSEDGVILVYNTASWEPICRFVDASPVRVLLWHNVGKSTDAIVSTARFSGPIHSLAISPPANLLAVGNGHNVQLVSLSSKAPYFKGDPKTVPDPPSFLKLSARLPAPIARSIHFQRDGKGIVVSYLSHGMICWDICRMTLTWQITPRACSIGRSDLHPDGATIAVSNLFDGVDWYSISSQKRVHSAKILISENLPTPLSYIHGGSALLVGGTSGKAHIIDCQSVKLLQTLDHNENGCIQSVTFTPDAEGRALIATGNAELASSPVIKIWHRPADGRWAKIR